MLFLLTNCKSGTIKEEKILSDIFYQLVDSFNIKNYAVMPPPPPAPKFDKDSNYIGIDSIRTKEDKIAYKKYLNRIDSIDSRHLIALEEKYLPMDWKNLREKVSISQKFDNTPKQCEKFSTKEIKIPEDFQLITKKHLEKEYGDSWRVTNRKFCGVIAISKIFLSQSKSLGIMKFEFYPHKTEGIGYYLLVEKDNKSWKIKNIYRNWES